MNGDYVPLVFNKADPMVIVFRLPEALPSGFCFSGGFAVNFQMVDWFQSRPELGEDALRDFIRRKPYYKAGGNFLVLARAGSAFLVDVPA